MPEPPRSQLRAGGRALAVLATPLRVRVLRALAERPMRLAELCKATGRPSQTTLRGHLTALAEIGVLGKRPARQMPYAVENELTPMGHELLDVAVRLEAWLRQAPGGPIPLASEAAKDAVKALIDGWGSTMMRALADQALSLTELDGLITDLSYPALERRLSRMRKAGLVKARQGQGAGIPYTVTDWARCGVGPLVAASHCEFVHLGPDAAPLTAVDVEAAFLLAAPLIALTESAAGSCQLEVEAGRDSTSGSKGVRVRVERGTVVSCVSSLEANPAAYAIGSAVGWFNAVHDGQLDQLRFGGSWGIAEEVVGGLHAPFRT